MSNQYLSLVRITIRDVDSQDFVAEGKVLVVAENSEAAAISKDAIEEFDHQNPEVRRIQPQIVHVPEILQIVELPLVIHDMRPGAKAKLVELVEACGGYQDVLDELVHSVYGKKASDVNNGGPEEQVEELIQELGPQGLGEELADRLNQVNEED